METQFAEELPWPEGTRTPLQQAPPPTPPIATGSPVSQAFLLRLYGLTENSIAGVRSDLATVARNLDDRIHSLETARESDVEHTEHRFSEFEPKLHNMEEKAKEKQQESDKAISDLEILFRQFRNGCG